MECWQVTALAERALGVESACAALAERELQQLHAAILCQAELPGLSVGPCATGCAAAWRVLGAHYADTGAGSCAYATRPCSPSAQEAEATLAALLVRTKSDVMAQSTAAAEAVKALHLSHHAARGGLWMDHSLAGADILSEDLVQRRY